MREQQRDRGGVITLVGRASGTAAGGVLLPEGIPFAIVKGGTGIYNLKTDPRLQVLAGQNNYEGGAVGMGIGTFGAGIATLIFYNAGGGGSDPSFYSFTLTARDTRT